MKELHKCRRRKIILKALLLVTVVALVATLVLAKIFVDKAKKEAQESARGPEQVTRSERKLQARIDELEEKLATSVQGRFPNLEQIEYDRVIPIENKYVKNVLFSVSKRAFDTQYEWQIKLLNTTTDVLKPRIRLFLFDNSGLQIGIADTEEVSEKSLIPDEARTHGGVFELNLEGEPTYYMFEIL